VVILVNGRGIDRGKLVFKRSVTRSRGEASFAHVKNASRDVRKALYGVFGHVFRNTLSMMPQGVGRKRKSWEFAKKKGKRGGNLMRDKELIRFTGMHCRRFLSESFLAGRVGGR